MSLRTNNVPILEVLDRLGYTYWSKGINEYGIYEAGEKTDGRSANTEKNRVTDFAEKGRPQGEPRGVVKLHFNYSDDQEIFKRFSDNFPSYTEQKSSKKSVKKIWDELHNLSEKQQAYLQGRGIDYEKVKEFVKDYNGAIGCMIYVGLTPVGINARRIDDSKTRFTALAGYETNGIYYGGLDKTKDYVIVVEGLIDFLTLKQYETNVVGLKAIGSGHEEIVKLAKNYKIKMVFDNDGKEEQAKKHLQSIKYSFFDWSVLNEVGYSAKDANDIHEIAKEEVVNLILDSQLEQTPILGTIKRFNERQEIIRIKGRLGDEGPYPEIYDMTQGVVRNKVYTIGAFSNVGKSKFAYSHVPFFLRKGEKVLYISLEENELDIFGNIACSYYNHSLSNQGTLKIKTSDFENLICIDNCHSLKEIQEAVALHKPDRVFIDYIQAIFEKGSQYEKGAVVAYGVQKIAIENNCTIFSLSQVSNSGMKEVGAGLEQNTIMLKGAGEYYAASDVVMILHRENHDDGMKIKIEKNKLGRKGKVVYSKVNWETNNFSGMFECTTSVF